MEYFFILGRNPNLSYAEILSYCKMNGIEYQTIMHKVNFLIMSFKQEVEFNVQDFGGMIKLGKILFSGDNSNLGRFLDAYIVDQEKFTYSVMGNKVDEIEDRLMVKFKKEKYKAQVKRAHLKLRLQEGDPVAVSNADQEFFYYEQDKKIYFGKADQDYSYKEVKERDMKKPFRREALAISPRLAKILVNLSQTKPGQLLLDPFCGVGGILQEALLKGINCYGIDKDKEAIIFAKKNMNWMNDNYEIKASYTLLNADSKNMPQLKVYGVATEPALGTLVKKQPNNREAEKFIKDFESLIIPILRRIKQVKTEDAKIVLTMPYIRNYSVNMEEIARETNLRLYKLDDILMPIKESREEQFIGREIIIFY